MLSQLFDVSAGLLQSHQPVPVLDCYKNIDSKHIYYTHTHTLYISRVQGAGLEWMLPV